MLNLNGCFKHGKLRTNVKTINFGLAYGKGPHKLADTLDISIKEAEVLIEKYLPRSHLLVVSWISLVTLVRSLVILKHFHHNRRRWFPTWYPRIYKDKSQAFELGSIERASKNTPISALSADMTKKALILIRDFIKRV